jgi:transposase
MAPHLSKPVIAGIECALAQPPPIDLYEIAATFRTTYETVRYRQYQMRVREIIGYDPRKKPGPASLITPEMEEALIEHIAVHNDLYLDEMADFLFDEFDVKVSNPLISKLLKRRQITNKKLKVIAQQQNEELIHAWHDKARWWRSDQLVFVDESAYNEKNGDRKTGWSEIGLSPVVERFLKRSKRWSVLPAYTLDGWEVPLCYQGSITGDIFEWWFEHDLIPRCGRYPEPKSIIIMDNCSIHHTPRIRQIADRAGVLIAWLPPYSPFLNPIEESFHDLKAYI